LFEFDTNLKIFPPLRSPEQVAALKTAIQAGIIDTLSSAHCAQGLEEKDCEFENAEAGMLNVQTFFALANETLVASGLISLARLMEIISQNPRKILGLPTSIVQENAPLDFTLFQPQAAWQLTAKDIPSRAKNSPFLGKELKGKVWGVLVGR
ncbi:MAG: dihydroorotase, partial [Bacteroidia bacterium]